MPFADLLCGTGAPEDVMLQIPNMQEIHEEEENKRKVKERKRRYREENKMKLREKGGDNLWNEKTKTGDREGEKAEDEIGGIVSV